MKIKDLQELRHSIIEIEKKNVLLLPEYELTDYPTHNYLTVEEAVQTIENFDAEIKIAGFAEENSSKHYSSCIVMENGKVYVARKYAPYKTEKGIIDPFNERPNIFNLSIGNTIILLCSDTMILIE